MGLFIKTIGRNGDKGLLNMQNVESITISKNKGVTFIPARGVDPHASCSPMVAYCTDKVAEIILDEIIDFMVVNADGVYDAYARVQELNQMRLGELQA